MAFIRFSNNCLIYIIIFDSHGGLSFDENCYEGKHHHRTITWKVAHRGRRAEAHHWGTPVSIVTSDHRGDNWNEVITALRLASSLTKVATLLLKLKIKDSSVSRFSHLDCLQRGVTTIYHVSLYHSIYTLHGTKRRSRAIETSPYFLSSWWVDVTHQYLLPTQVLLISMYKYS